MMRHYDLTLQRKPTHTGLRANLEIDTVISILTQGEIFYNLHEIGLLICTRLFISLPPSSNKTLFQTGRLNL